jgi:hypothetical protein
MTAQANSLFFGTRLVSVIRYLTIDDRPQVLANQKQQKDAPNQQGG